MFCCMLGKQTNEKLILEVDTAYKKKKHKKQTNKNSFKMYRIYLMICEIDTVSCPFGLRKRTDPFSDPVEQVDYHYNMDFGEDVEGKPSGKKEKKNTKKLESLNCKNQS